MTLSLTPTSLLAILVLTSVIVSVSRQPDQSSLTQAPPPSTSHPELEHRRASLPFNVGLNSQQHPQSLQLQSSTKGTSPIKLQLRWRSESTMPIQTQTPSSSEMPPPPLPARAEDTSHVHLNNRSMKRFSVQLPLQSTSNVKEILSSSAVTSPKSPLPLVSAPASARPATPEGNDFLTALAAQERRVLELKEELAKAETDLTKLKKKWAVHEASKKRNEIRHLEPMTPLKSPKKKDLIAPQEPSAERKAREETRKRAMSIKTRQTQRTVFEGGRHTRTLSLLSPTSLSLHSSIPSPAQAQPQLQAEGKHSEVPKTAIPRVSTAPVERHHQQAKDAREDLMHSGKQLVGDLKDGLWTFIEDLRQATVGDEAVTSARSKRIGSATDPTPSNDNKTKGEKTLHKKPSSAALRKTVPPGMRKASPTTSLSPQHARHTSAGSIEIDTVTNPKATQRAFLSKLDTRPTTASTTTTTNSTDEDDGWSNWDSPPPKSHNSSASNGSGGTAQSTPRTSLRQETPHRLSAFPRI